MRIHATSLLLASLLAAGILPSPSPAQQPGGQAPQEQALKLKPHALIAQLPEAQDTPAPDWIVPGVRLTYFTSVAQVNDAAGESGLVEDPNGDIRSSDGRKFRMATVGQGVGGTGWDCADILAVEPGVVVVEMRSFFNSNGHQGPVTAAGLTSVFVHPSGCDFFIHPRLLGKLQPRSGDGSSLIRGTKSHRGAPYDVLLAGNEAAGSRLMSVYDLASGAQLSHNSSTLHQGKAIHTPGPDGSLTPRNANSRTLANNQYHGARKIEIPWPTMRIPEWARTMKSMRFAGRRIDSGTPGMGLGRLVTDLTFEIAPAHLGRTYIAYQTKSTMALEGMPAFPPVTGLVASGCRMPGVWLDPDAMRGVRSGQAIDRDPNLGVETLVESVGAEHDGRKVIVFASGNALYRSTSTYDLATGQLVAMGRTEKSPTTGGTLTTNYQLVQSR